MPKAETDQTLRPLTRQEEAAWRALGRAMLIIPRLLDSDLLEAQGLTVTEYSVLFNLSEAPDRSLRMGDLARAVSITLSGMSRVVDRLSRQGLVQRVRDPVDGRGQIAILSTDGLRRLERAWPTHLASVRRHVIDHLAGVDLKAFARAMTEIGAEELGPPARRASPDA